MAAGAFVRDTGIRQFYTARAAAVVPPLCPNERKRRVRKRQRGRHDGADAGASPVR